MCSVKHCRIHYLKQFIDCPDIVRFFPSFCRVRVASLILSRQWTKWDSGCKPIPWQWPIRNDFILSISKSINETEHDQISLCMTWWWEMWPGWAHFLTHSLPCRVCVCVCLCSVWLSFILADGLSHRHQHQYQHQSFSFCHVSLEFMTIACYLVSLEALFSYFRCLTTGLLIGNRLRMGKMRCKNVLNGMSFCLTLALALFPILLSISVSFTHLVMVLAHVKCSL